MSTTRRAASSSRAQTSWKCRVSPRRAASDTIAQRPRTAAALCSTVAPAAASLVEGTAFGAAQLGSIRGSRRGEIPCRLLCRHFDRRIEGHQSIGNRQLLYHLDPLGLECIALVVRHRHPAIDPADAEPVEDVGHQLLKAHVLYAGDAFGAAEIAVGGVAAGLPLAGIVDEELGDLAERPPLLAVVNDDPYPALLRGLDADFDAVDEVRTARADIGAEDIRAVALVMDAAGDNRLGVGDPFDVAKEINRHPADRRQQDFDIGPGDELGEHPPGLLEQGAPEVGLGYPKARGHPRQMPYRIDRRLGDADLPIIEQHPAVRAQGAGGEQRAQLGSGDPCPGDRDRRAYVDAGTDMFGEDLTDEMAPGVV